MATTADNDFAEMVGFSGRITMRKQGISIIYEFDVAECFRRKMKQTVVYSAKSHNYLSAIAAMIEDAKSGYIVVDIEDLSGLTKDSDGESCSTELESITDFVEFLGQFLEQPDQLAPLTAQVIDFDSDPDSDEEDEDDEEEDDFEDDTITDQPDDADDDEQDEDDLEEGDEDDVEEEGEFDEDEEQDADADDVSVVTASYDMSDIEDSTAEDESESELDIDMDLEEDDLEDAEYEDEEGDSPVEGSVTMDQVQNMDAITKYVITQASGSVSLKNKFNGDTVVATLNFSPASSTVDVDYESDDEQWSSPCSYSAALAAITGSIPKRVKIRGKLKIKLGETFITFKNGEEQDLCAFVRACSIVTPNVFLNNISEDVGATIEFLDQIQNDMAGNNNLDAVSILGSFTAQTSKGKKVMCYGHRDEEGDYHLDIIQGKEVIKSFTTVKAAWKNIDWSTVKVLPSQASMEIAGVPCSLILERQGHDPVSVQDGDGVQKYVHQVGAEQAAYSEHQLKKIVDGINKLNQRVQSIIEDTYHI